MNSLTSSPTTGRCGMCGSCGTMPPWAPERLKNTSPEARLALERRMKEAQKRFIEQRDAKRALQANAPEHASPSEHHDEPLPSQLSPSESETQMTASTQQGYETKQKEQNISQVAAGQSSEQLSERHLRHAIGNEFTTEPRLKIEDADKIALTNTTQLECGGDIENDVNDDIPLDSVEIPSQPANNACHEKNTIGLVFDASQIPHPSRRKQPRFASPVIPESPASHDATELDMLPEISLEPVPLSEPLRTISLRDADSDADSFHTAEGEVALRRSADSLRLKDEEDSEKDIVPIINEVEWQAFQDGGQNAEPEVASKVSESAGSVSAISSTDEDASLEGFTKEMNAPAQPISNAENLGSQSDDNLEDSTATTSASPKATRDSLVDDYALPADLVQSSKVTLDPTRCDDCERWRERVRELEFKVEALTSALSAREMESASMRARVADRRYVGKNAAQLMEECESLRMTTEYLVRFHLCRTFVPFLTNIFVNDPFHTSSITSWKDTSENLTEAILLYTR